MDTILYHIHYNNRAKENTVSRILKCKELIEINNARCIRFYDILFVQIKFCLAAKYLKNNLKKLGINAKRNNNKRSNNKRNNNKRLLQLNTKIYQNNKCSKSSIKKRNS